MRCGCLSRSLKPKPLGVGRGRGGPTRRCSRRAALNVKPSQNNDHARLAAERRSDGALSWYRANLTIPAKVGDFDTAGARAVLTVLVDDYGEVWVDGQMPRRAGFPSPATIQGFNMPNRVVLADAVKPGDKFQIAVFGINGPISVAPANTVWFREARIEFYR